MERIIVIGCPGSGKSTFSRALQKITGIPLYHLDMMNWNSDRTRWLKLCLKNVYLIQFRKNNG